MQAIYTRIARPTDQHAVASPNAYLRLLATTCAEMTMRRATAFVTYPRPHSVRDAAMRPLIRQGCWIVLCKCGNAPAYDPEWELACCLDCAAIYHVAPPERWREIEATLMRRPRAVNRNCEVGEMLADLRAENDAAGLGEGA